MDTYQILRITFVASLLLVIVFLVIAGLKQARYEQARRDEQLSEAQNRPVVERLDEIARAK